MPSLDTVRRMTATKYNGAKTLGQIRKEESDFIMEETWDDDIQSRICYIYDYKHDDQPTLNVGMTYENTTKTKIDAKFIVSKYGSIDKDQIEYHLQFKPSQPVFFNPGDELYYYETDYRQKYGVSTFPVGLFCDIPDDNGVYHKWLICAKEIANQFVKYYILPCNYYYQWIIKEKEKRIKCQMWGVDRQQLSYDAGSWRDYNFEAGNNVEKILLPLNPVTENIYYTDDNENMRIIISARVKHPMVWRVTKVESTKPQGLLSITVKQDMFNPHTDYVNLETGEMYADYYDTKIEPVNADTTVSSPLSVRSEITASTPDIKVGGSYKLLTVHIYDKSGANITEQYTDKDFQWTGFVLDNDFTDKIIWGARPNFNQIKIKFPNDKSYLDEILKVKCIVDGIESTVSFNIVN